MKYYDYPKLFVLALPVTIFFVTFFIVPMVQLAIVGGSSDAGLSSYFSIPRVILTIMAAAEKLDKSLEEVAKSLGAPPYRIVIDIIIPALKPGLIASGAICFATSMGAFGTAFTLATNIDVLPMTIYTEFTLNANIAGAASLSIVLGLVTWIALFISRSLSGQTIAVSG